ncbi:MAG: glycosyltransferase family 4 protein [candidate division Zixibacteria bacterium]|nr:glycosyltransferase family 4 protein [candidate division Zixibacteria bacterium]
MKLLFLADGSSYHTKRWVNFFAQENHQCYLLSLEEIKEVMAETYYIRPKLKIRGLKYISSYFQVKRVVENIKPDLINALFVPNYGFLGALLNFKPLVVSAWGSDILISAHKSFLHRLRAKFVLNKADLILSDSNVLTERIIELGMDEKKILTFPLGIEIDKYLRPKETKDTITILSIRRFEPVYDVKTLIQAIPLVLENSKRKVRFIIIGSGSQSKQLKGLAHNLESQDKVIFKENLSDEELIQTYGDSDIYVSTSLSDSTSVSLLEAMASRLIPVVTDIPGNREWIEDGKNGLLFRPKDHKGLAQKINLALDNFEKYQSMCEVNLEILKKKADWKSNIQMVERKFLEMVKKR